MGQSQQQMSKTMIDNLPVRTGKSLQPSTRNWVDVGINLKSEPAGSRLEPAGSFNAMVSHRVRLTSVKDVNAELKPWLKKAYQAA